jgi:CRP/FNR family cyclic AMP-dependent transcriptional regulator
MSGLLRYISEEDEVRLLAGANVRVCADGEVILCEGDRLRSLFVLLAGAARVERRHCGFDVEIARLEEGELFGEMGFIEDYPASASVVACGSCRLQVVNEDRVRAMTVEHPEFAGRFYRSLAELLSRRLRASSAPGLSEFSWGPGGFQRPQVEAAAVALGGAAWGGGSPLRDADG